MQNESELQRHTHRYPKPVLPACVRNDCQQAGVSHKPCSQETSADNHIETFSVRVCALLLAKNMFKIENPSPVFVGCADTEYTLAWVLHLYIYVNLVQCGFGTILRCFCS